MHFYFQYLNFQQISKSSYFNKVRLYKSVSFYSWLSFNMYPSLWNSVCILNSISTVPCTRLITLLLRWVGRLSARNWFNHTSGVTAVTPTDRPKSIRNRCVIKVFGGFLVHLSQRLKCTIVITRCPSSVCLSVCPSVVSFSHFRLLLWNCSTEFNET